MENFEINKLLEEETLSCYSLSIEMQFLKACMEGDYIKMSNIFESNKIDPNLGIVSACRGGYIEIVKFLLTNGANPNYIDKKQKNWTPILAAMVGNNWDNSNKDEIVNELVKFGGEITPWIFHYIHYYNKIVNVVKISSNFELSVLNQIF